jgi:ubiquinone/menaquinone biosynthesis C-methylase UbiE
MVLEAGRANAPMRDAPLSRRTRLLDELLIGAGVALSIPPMPAYLAPIRSGKINSTMSCSAVHHPVFARLWSVMSRHEPADIRRHRDELLAGLSGRVIEIGAGTGSNFAHYPPTVEEVVAVEPEPYMRRQAQAAAGRAEVRIEVVDGVAERLPAEDCSFDAAVACLVLCTVSDQAGALAELWRVLRPGGELRFYEHVLSDRAAVAFSQRTVDRTFWPHAFGGCHTARDTPTAIVNAGFELGDQRRMWVNPVSIAFPVGSHAIGRARRR